MTPQRIYESPYPMPDVPTNLSVSQFLLTTNPDDAKSSQTILADFDDPKRELTYGGLRDNAARDATILRDVYHIREGDTVCIYAYNSVDWASLAHAILWAGGCFCGINPLATTFELIHYIEVASPKVIAVENNLLPNVLDAATQLKAAPTIIVLDNTVVETPSGYPTYPGGFHREAALPAEPFDLSKGDNRQCPAGMCFSSGTSGRPKGVVFSHHNLIAQTLSIRATNPFLHNGHMREVFFPSFSHVYGIVSALLVPAWVGSYAQAMKKFDYMQYLRRCSEIQATVLRIVPSVAVRMVKDPEVRQLNFGHVRGVMCSGAALSEDVARDLKSMLPKDSGVLNGYGMSESTVTLLREMRKDKGASVGRVSAGMAVRVVDDNYEDVEPGKNGECLIKGPTVFMEYKGNSKETQEAKIDGWLRSGDVVRVDEDGYFYLTGRKKELIKFKGNQIAPAELEAVLLLHPQVLDAGVCGVHDKSLGTEIAVGFVSLDAGIPVGQHDRVLDEIRDFVNQRVASYKRFRERLFYMETLPKNASGKLLRRHLVARATKLRSREQRL